MDARQANTWNAATETLITSADRIYSWVGGKMKATMLSAKLGRLVLTDRRLVFLSTGKSDLRPGRGISTSHLDDSALANEGSLSFPVAAITTCEVGKKRALVVSFRDHDGSERSYAFGERMGMPDGARWVAQINELRSREGSKGSQPEAARCDSCGRLVTFEGDESAIVTITTSGSVTTLCLQCHTAAEKERVWRQTGIWVGGDLPPSLGTLRAPTEEERRQIFGTSAPDDVAEERDGP